jgi:hypothetical protein
MTIKQVKYQYFSETGNTMQFKLANQCSNTFTTPSQTIFILKNKNKELQFDKDMQTDYAINAGLFSSGFISLNQDYKNIGFGIFDARYKFWNSTKLTQNCKLKTLNNNGFIYEFNDNYLELYIYIFKDLECYIDNLYYQFIENRLSIKPKQTNNNRTLYTKSVNKK